MKYIIIFLCLLLSFFAVLPDGRAKVGHDNIIILIDISGSTQISNIKKKTKPFTSFIQIIDKLLNSYIVPGDYVKFLTFSTVVKELTPGQVISENDKSEKKSMLRLLKNFDQDYMLNYKRYSKKKRDQRIQHTDMGNALEAVSKIILEDQPGDPANRNLVLIVTDGKHDAAPNTKYDVSGIALENLLKKASQNILNENWTIRCFGFGEKADLELIAKVINDPNPIKSENIDDIVNGIGKIIQSKVELIHGVIDIDLYPSFTGAYEQKINVDLEMINNYQMNKRIEIFPSKCRFIPNQNAQIQLYIKNIEPLNIYLPSRTRKTFQVQLDCVPASSKIQSGLVGKIQFKYKSAVRFYPNIIPVNINVYSWMDTWKFYVYTITPIMLFLIIIITVKAVRGKKPKIRISLLVNSKNVSETSEVLNKGDSYYIGVPGFTVPGLNTGKAVVIKYLGNNKFQLNPAENIEIEISGTRYQVPFLFTIKDMQTFSIIEKRNDKKYKISGLEIVEGTGVKSHFSSDSDFEDSDDLGAL